MTKLIAISIIALSGQMASANLITVEFQSCTANKNYVCAKVYLDQTDNIQYNGQEMGVESPASLNATINGLISDGGISLTKNIEGKVQSINDLSGRKYNKLWVNSLTNAGSRPRNL